MLSQHMQIDNQAIASEMLINYWFPYYYIQFTELSLNVQNKEVNL